MPTLPFGKLKPRDLERLLGAIPARRGAGVVVGPALGEDAAVLRVGRRLLVVATDPVTFTADEIGHYAVAINANDVAVMGARPRWLQVCLLLPPIEKPKLKRLFNSIVEAARRQDVTITGGHTEVTSGIDRPIVIGTMMGDVTLPGHQFARGARTLLIMPVGFSAQYSKLTPSVVNVQSSVQSSRQGRSACHLPPSTSR